MALLKKRVLHLFKPIKNRLKYSLKKLSLILFGRSIYIILKKANITLFLIEPVKNLRKYNSLSETHSGQPGSNNLDAKGQLLLGLGSPSRCGIR